MNTTQTTAAKMPTAETAATLARKLANRTNGSCQAIRALAAAIADQCEETAAECGECPVQQQIIAAMFALADQFEAAEEATF